MRRREAGAIAVIAVAPGAAAPTGAAGRAPVTVSPTAPGATDPITVTWTAKRAFEREVFEISAGTGGSFPGCSSAAVTVRRAVRRGARIKVRLRPRPRWCEDAPLTIQVAGTLRSRVVAGGTGIGSATANLTLTLNVDLSGSV